MDLGSKSFTATHPSRRISFVLRTAIAGMFPVPKPCISCQIWTNSQAPSRHYTSGSSGTPNPIEPNETYISPTLPSAPNRPWLLFLLLHTLSERCHNSHHSRPGPSDFKVHMCVCVFRRFSCIRLFVTPWSVVHQAPSLGKNTGVGCHAILQGFLTQGSNMSLLQFLNCRQILYCCLQHRTLLLSPVTSTAGYCFCFGSIPSFFLELFLH